MKHMISMSAVVAALSLTAIGTQSPAATENCGDFSNQAEMNACYGKVLAAEDKNLNVSYREIEKRLVDDADARKLLLAAERAWLAYRDAECAFSASGNVGGSVYPTAVAICKTTLTSRRNKDLKAYLACKEGDMTCPVPALPRR